MSLGDLHDRLLAAEHTAAADRQRLDLLQSLLAAHGEALAELLRRTAPRVSDDLSALERSLATNDVYIPQRSSQGSSLPDLAEHLAASPEAGNGGAPQGLPRRETHCAICDSDAHMSYLLPSGDTLTLKGGGFVCEGCVVTAYEAER